MNALKSAARFVLGLLLLLIVGMIGAVLFATGARAQAAEARCMPYVPNSEWVWDELHTPATPSGMCIRWRCTKVGAPMSQWVTYCGLWSEIPKVGGRVDTIRKAADPLKSLNTAGKRFPILPLSDPRFDTLRDEAFK